MKETPWSRRAWHGAGIMELTVNQSHLHRGESERRQEGKLFLGLRLELKWEEAGTAVATGARDVPGGATRPQSTLGSVGLRFVILSDGRAGL